MSAYGSGTIVAYPLDDALAVGEGRTVVRGLSNSDSFCLDAAGNLYLGTRYGLRVGPPDGSQTKLIRIPGGSSSTGTTNCSFGGTDGRTLYITSFHALYRVENIPIPGLDWVVNRRRQRCP